MEARENYSPLAQHKLMLTPRVMVGVFECTYHSRRIRCEWKHMRFPKPWNLYTLSKSLSIFTAFIGAINTAARIDIFKLESVVSDVFT